MSFILDALKKSENERQRTVGPSLADAPLRRARVDRPWWAVAVAALLIVNLGVLIVVLMRDGATAQPAATIVQPAPNFAIPADTAERAQQTALMPARPVLPPTSAPATANSPAVHSLADEAGSTGSLDPGMSPALSAASAVPSGPSMVRPIQPPIQPPAVASLTPNATFPALSASGNDSRSDEVLPTAGDLAASGTSLPDLKLDIHVFSKNPVERFVFVNMRKYLEGQTLQEGPAIEKITTDGVVLNQHGLRYVLPRQ